MRVYTQRVGGSIPSARTNKIKGLSRNPRMQADRWVTLGVTAAARRAGAFLVSVAAAASRPLAPYARSKSITAADVTISIRVSAEQKEMLDQIAKS